MSVIFRLSGVRLNVVNRLSLLNRARMNGLTAACRDTTEFLSLVPLKDMVCLAYAQFWKVPLFLGVIRTKKVFDNF